MSAIEFVVPHIIDIEASGFGANSYPIEVGIVTSAGNKFCRLIKPLPDWQHWSEEAEQLHGISQDVLIQFGLDARLVCEQLNQFCAGMTLYSDGWVVDYPWLIKLYSAVGMRMSFRISPLEMILSQQQMQLWQSEADKQLQGEDTIRHRASNDAWRIQQVFINTCQVPVYQAFV